MGTNVYLHHQVCGHCDRAAERVHVGKSSAGWVWLWRGYRGAVEGLPLGCEIVSAVDWVGVLADLLEDSVAPGVLRDEYGVELSLTDLCDWVVRKRDGGRQRVSDGCFADGGDDICFEEFS